ncbi:thiosulfate oxidation carrier complex protein SoxZ [Rhodoplanes serenus]|jgi:sulfur-oxidizing protein SoxZ|uniref:Thiosulfate oxidation carrier complex protein SoxZ n=1 Tax=Rhodoplanes serenus TaxID=200615 RepID=A0A9X4XLI4_9BRAD|nr:thiosulfate oxidation carrier complex protein SoxZ [Rhodoplanes serenus]MTW17393.1 thiosulfate oxidation carrier complex protein SoxZ [Rhodoplanes serenus]
MTNVKPRIRLDRKDIKKGDTIEVKALVSHTMESGQRKDKDGNTVPRKIINKFTCTMNQKTLFACDLEPAISANPYFHFKLKPQESGPLIFTWLDDDGTRIEATETITVS